jgi:hypothetical protein
MTFLFGKIFRTFTDLLKHHFKLLQLFWGDILERTFDGRRVPAKERDEHLPSFFQSMRPSLQTHSSVSYHVVVLTIASCRTPELLPCGQQGGNS